MVSASNESGPRLRSGTASSTVRASSSTNSGTPPAFLRIVCTTEGGRTRSPATEARSSRAGRGVERVERDRRGVLGVSPLGREFGPMRHEQQRRQPRDPLDEHRQEVERRGVRPMRVLHQKQDRRVSGHARKPPRQHAVYAPRASRCVEFEARLRFDSEEILEKACVLGEQRRRRRDQRIDSRPPLLG